MKSILSTILICCFVNAYGQEVALEKTYYGRYWIKTNDLDQAVYYRTVEKVNSAYAVKNYYKSGKLERAITCTAVEPRLIWKGNTIVYYENGIKKQEGNFVNGIENGLQVYWYENGAKQKEVDYEKGEAPIYRQYWSIAGVPLIINGTGLIHETAGLLGEQTIEIKDNKRFSSFGIGAAGDTIYNFVETSPEYKGGPEALYKDIASVLRYPAVARRSGVQGKVFIQFVVNTKGNILSAEVIKGISPECDAEALRTIKTLGAWTPGKHYGKPVNVLYVLPLNYRLK